MTQYFDETTHTYWKDGKIIPGVSGVLEMNPVDYHLHKYFASGKKFEGVKAFQDFGKKVHDLAYRAVNGEILEFSDNASDRKILKMIDFVLDYMQDVRILGQEKCLFGKDFGGTPDIWGIKNSHLSIMDYKTNQKSKSDFERLCLNKYFVQLGGYAELLLQINVIATKLTVLHLPTEMEYTVDAQEYIYKFNRLLDIYNGKEMYGVKIKDVVMMWNSGMDVKTISDIIGISYADVNTVIETNKEF